MLHKLPALFISLLAIGFASGCSIVKSVSPAPASSQISTVYVKKNERVLMEGLHPEIVSQIQAHGFAVETFEGAQPLAATHVLTYTANWRWDLAMYLVYFEATLHENSQVIGRAKYDALRGGSRFDKFGPTADKIRPLLTDLFQAVPRSQPAAPVAATSLGGE